MTPKFDNLASLLMEMPQGVAISDEKRLEIATYIEQFPEVTYEKLADAFEVSLDTVNQIAKELDIQRGYPAGKETHFRRKLTDVQEKEILDYWLANHYEMSLGDLTKWVNQQFNVVMYRTSMKRILKRVAAKHNKRLPTTPRGSRPSMRRTADKHRNEPGTGKLPTQSSQHFSGSTDIVPSNPKHGGPAHPPK